MRILDRIEHLLESFFEGRAPRQHDSIQPVEIGRKLVKAMEAHRRISIAHTYVPNIYVIRLHPDQLQGLETLQHTLKRELRGFLQQKAEEKNLSFIGSLEITFAAGSDVEPGQVEIDASFQEADYSSTAEYTLQVPEPARPEQTQVYTAQAERDLPVLHVQGQEQHMVYQVIPERQSIGRSPECDLVINDPSASRVHAWLEPQGGSWKLIDNNSTNGTYLNERRIKEQLLTNGDQIRIGTTIIVFRAGEG